MGRDIDEGRRQFLKTSVWSMGKAVYEYCEQQKPKPPEPQQGPSNFRMDWLRPPGAVEEALFLDRCTRCGDCLPACPYGSIKKDPANGYPVLFADESPCFLCDDFPCIAACATEALLSVHERGAIRMGLAVLDEAKCTADQGCRVCLSKCPVEALGEEFPSPYPVVDQAKCVGCGICEQVCSTVNDKVALRVISGRSAGAPSGS